MFKTKKNKWQVRYKELNTELVKFLQAYDMNSLKEFQKFYTPDMVIDSISVKNDIEMEIAQLNAVLDHLKRAKEHILEL